MRALILDEATPARSDFAKALKGRGYDVLQSATAAGALSMLEARGGVDLALLNWELPRSQGLSFAVGVRELRCSEHAFLIMLTRLRDVSEILEAIHAGVDDCLIPPLTPERLLRKLAELQLGSASSLRPRQGVRVSR